MSLRASIKPFLAAAQMSLILFASTGVSAASAEGISASSTDSKAAPSEFQALLGRLDRAQKKGKASDIADALYDLAKAYFEGRDLQQAEKYMRLAMDKESGLNRPEADMRTRVALAAILVSNHRIEEALTVYKQALKKAQESHLNDQAAILVDSMGTLALESGRYDEAESSFNQARDLAVSAGSAASQSSALINLAIVARARNHTADSLKLSQQAVSLVKGDRDPRVLAAALTELGRSQADLGNADEALNSLRQAADIYKGELESLSRAKVLISMGQTWLTQDKPMDARTAFQEAVQLLKEEPSNKDLLLALRGLGSAEAQAGHFSEADAALQEAITLARTTKSSTQERILLSEMGYLDCLRGAPEKGLGKYLEAYSMLESQDPSDERTKGVLNCDIAMTYKALGQTAAAIKYYGQAVSELEHAGDLPGRAMALNSLAVAYLDSGQAAEFEKYYQQAWQAFSSLHNIQGQALLTYNRAQYTMMQGHYADAIPLYEESLSLMRSIGNTKGAGQVLRGLGLSYLSLGRSGKALEIYKQALPEVYAQGNPEAIWDCELGLGKSYNLLADTNEAEVHLRKAVELVEKERRQLSRDTAKTYNMDLRQDCFLELADVLVKKQEIPEALVVAERGRARAFLDLLEGRQTRRPGELLVEAPKAPDQKPTTAPPVAPHKQDGTRAIEIVPRPAAVVEASAISEVNALPPSLDEIKSLVAKSNSHVLEYYVLPDKILSFIVHPDGTIDLPPPAVIARQQLSDKVAALYKLVTSHPQGKTPSEIKASTQLLGQMRENSLKDLYKLLIEPSLPYLPKQPESVITIVPHGQLFSVPFAALLSANSRFLIEDHTLCFAPAIGVLRATQKLEAKASQEANSLVAFGNPITPAISFLGALPYAQKEVEHIAGLFPATAAQVEIGAKASKSTFQEFAPKFKYVHVATHGLVNEEHPMESAVVLAPQGADDGLLTVKDILQLPALKSRLVVLSACQTGRGKITGDGVVGLSRAFIIAGAPSIIVSQWNVDDVMTEYQMVSFYKELLKGTGMSACLRQAQLNTIAFMEHSSPKSNSAESTSAKAPASLRANPRYWSAFQLIGQCQ